MKRIAVVAALAVTFAVGGAGASGPTPTGPVLQVPGGSTFQAPLGAISFGSSGSMGRSGGITYTYSGIDSTLLSSYSDLEWGITNAQLAFDDPGFGSPSNTLTFNSSAS